MSKKARRRPSWGKYRQKYGKWAVYYQKTKHVYGDLLEELSKALIEEIVKECQTSDRFYQDTLQKFPLLREQLDRSGLEYTQEHFDNGTQWVW